MCHVVSWYDLSLANAAERNRNGAILIISFCFEFRYRFAAQNQRQLVRILEGVLALCAWPVIWSTGRFGARAGSGAARCVIGQNVILIKTLFLLPGQFKSRKISYLHAGLNYTV